MTKSTPVKERPRSPHVTVYGWSITMAMSIAHRLTGVALYFGTVFVVFWLTALSMGGEYAEFMHSLYTSVFGYLVLFAYSFALFHHMLGGVRHLVWDLWPQLLNKHCASKAAWLTIAGSLFLTLLLWLTVFFIK